MYSKPKRKTPPIKCWRFAHKEADAVMETHGLELEAAMEALGVTASEVWYAGLSRNCKKLCCVKIYGDWPGEINAAAFAPEGSN